MKPHLHSMFALKQLQHFSFHFKNVSMPDGDKFYDIIDHTSSSIEHIQYFNNIIRRLTFYRPSELHVVTDSQNYDAVIPQSENHIQILHGSLHWIACYHDSQTIHVYDSLNQKKVDFHQRHMLKTLYPHRFPTQGYFTLNVKFPEVQHQDYSSDCGFHSMAFCISRIFEYDPSFIQYHIGKVREHARYIFKNNCFEHFPSTYDDSTYRI